jgi:hypothetical protein
MNAAAWFPFARRIRNTGIAMIRSSVRKFGRVSMAATDSHSKSDRRWQARGGRQFRPPVRQ